MKGFFPLLLQCPLFSGVSELAISNLLECLKAQWRPCTKGQFIFYEGDPVRRVGLVLSGSVQILRQEYDGSRSILANIAPGELFGEIFACAGLTHFPVSVQVTQEGQVLFMDFQQLITTCGQACSFHQQVITNLLRILSGKNLILNQKIRCMSQTTTQEKLMTFLLEQAKQHGKPEFIIPFDRQALADYLGVERSAMSAEISKLKKQGRIDTKGSWFHLITHQNEE